MVRASKQAGFTIVELLIVIIVIAILAAITLVAYNGITNKAKQSGAQSAVAQANQKVLVYMADNADTVPTSLAAAGLANDANTSYQFSSNSSASPQTFCVTATSNNISYFVNNTTQTSPAAGACPGHGVNGAIPITNLVPNPSFEVGSASWNWTNSNGYTGAISSARSTSGTSSFAITAPATVADSYFETYVTVPCPATYSFRASVYLTGNGATIGGRDAWFHVGNYLSGSCSFTNSTEPQYDRSKLNQWQTVTKTITINGTGTASLRIRFYGPASSTTYIDGVMVTATPAVQNYADGSTSNWVWNGAANNSTSTGSPL